MGTAAQSVEYQLEIIITKLSILLLVEQELISHNLMSVDCSATLTRTYSVCLDVSRECNDGAIISRQCNDFNFK